MSGILEKKEMSEEDIKLNYITPTSFEKGWKYKITMETKSGKASITTPERL